MQVKVLLFGILKDRFAAAELPLELEVGATVDAVRKWAQRVLGDDSLLRSVAIAVNREYAGPETALQEGDEVALLPPVSGGCKVACGLGASHV